MKFVRSIVFLLLGIFPSVHVAQQRPNILEMMVSSVLDSQLSLLQQFEGFAAEMKAVKTHLATLMINEIETRLEVKTLKESFDRTERPGTASVDKVAECGPGVSYIQESVRELLRKGEDSRSDIAAIKNQVDVLNANLDSMAENEKESTSNGVIIKEKVDALTATVSLMMQLGGNCTPSIQKVEESIAELMLKEEESMFEASLIKDKIDTLGYTMASMQHHNEDSILSMKYVIEESIAKQLRDEKEPKLDTAIAEGKVNTVRSTPVPTAEYVEDGMSLFPDEEYQDNDIDLFPDYQFGFDEAMQNASIAAHRIFDDLLKDDESKTKEKTNPKDCKDVLERGDHGSGVYTIFPAGPDEGVNVFCDQGTDGGGWTVMLRRERKTHQVNFTRTFEEYAAGFGSPRGELWLGNRVLHSLTREKQHMLRVEAKNLMFEFKEATWGTFEVGSEFTQFTLTVGGYFSNSTLGDGLSKVVPGHHSNRMKFWTVDKPDRKNCAMLFKGGWWYNRCYGCHPTAPLGDHDLSEFSNWWFWNNAGEGDPTGLSEVQFKIRPR